MKGSIYLRKTNDPHWVVSWPDGKKRYKITHYLGEPDLMYQTNQNKKHDTGYKKAEKLLALMQGDVERNCFRIEKYTGGRLPDPEVARKAVDELISAATCFEAAHNNPLFEDYKEESIADLQRTKAAVLRLMGVEVERWQRNEDPRDANSVMSVFTPD